MTKIDQLTLTLIAAVINGASLMIGMYLGTRMTGDVFEKKLTKMIEKSSTAQRLTKLLEMSDKLFESEQAVEQFTRFFKEAADLVSSKEAKNFFKNVTELMKDLGSEPEVKLKLPKKKEV